MVADEDNHDAVQFARRLRGLSDAGVVDCYLSILVLDELAWSLSGPLCDHEFGEGTWQRSNRQEAFVDIRETVADVIEALLDEGWLQIAPTDSTCGQTYLDTMREYALAPADAAHLTVAVVNDIEAIVTNDHHFLHLESPPIQVMAYANGK